MSERDFVHTLPQNVCTYYSPIRTQRVEGYANVYIAEHL
jgi:hypothetical protein